MELNYEYTKLRDSYNKLDSLSGGYMSARKIISDFIYDTIEFNDQGLSERAILDGVEEVMQNINVDDNNLELYNNYVLAILFDFGSLEEYTAALIYALHKVDVSKQLQDEYLASVKNFVKTNVYKIYQYNGNLLADTNARKDDIVKFIFEGAQERINKNKGTENLDKLINTSQSVKILVDKLRLSQPNNSQNEKEEPVRVVQDSPVREVVVQESQECKRPNNFVFDSKFMNEVTSEAVFQLLRQDYDSVMSALNSKVKVYFTDYIAKFNCINKSPNFWIDTYLATIKRIFESINKDIIKFSNKLGIILYYKLQNKLTQESFSIFQNKIEGDFTSLLKNVVNQNRFYMSQTLDIKRVLDELVKAIHPLENISEGFESTYSQFLEDVRKKLFVEPVKIDSNPVEIEFKKVEDVIKPFTVKPVTVQSKRENDELVIQKIQAMTLSSLIEIPFPGGDINLNIRNILNIKDIRKYEELLYNYFKIYVNNTAFSLFKNNDACKLSMPPSLEDVNGNMHSSSQIQEAIVLDASLVFPTLSRVIETMFTKQESVISSSLLIGDDTKTKRIVDNVVLVFQAVYKLVFRHFDVPASDIKEYLKQFKVKLPQVQQVSKVKLDVPQPTANRDKLYLTIKYRRFLLVRFSNDTNIDIKTKFSKFIGSNIGGVLINRRIDSHESSVKYFGQFSTKYTTVIEEVPISYEYQYILVSKYISMIRRLMFANVTPTLAVPYNVTLCAQCEKIDESKIIVYYELPSVKYVRLDEWLGDRRHPSEILSVFFQIFNALYSLETYLGLVYSKISAYDIYVFSVDACGYWKYTLFGTDYYVPNYGQFVLVYGYTNLVSIDNINNKSNASNVNSVSEILINSVNYEVIRSYRGLSDIFTKGIFDIIKYKFLDYNWESLFSKFNFFTQPHADKNTIDIYKFNKDEQEFFDGIDSNGLNMYGFNPYDQYSESIVKTKSINSYGFDKDGLNVNGYDKYGYSKDGLDIHGYNKLGFDKDGFNKEGYDKLGFDVNGFNRMGLDKDGYDRLGYNINGYNKFGFDVSGHSILGFNFQGYLQDGLDINGYTISGLNEKGFYPSGYNEKGVNSAGFTTLGYKDGYNISGVNIWGKKPEDYNEEGYDQEGYDKLGYNKEGFDRAGYSREGLDKNNVLRVKKILGRRQA